AGQDGGGDVPLVGECAQDQAANFGAAGADVPAHFDAAGGPELEVDHGDVRTCGRDAADGVPGRRRLAHDLQIRLGVQERAQAPTDELVVLDDEHQRRRGGVGR